MTAPETAPPHPSGIRGRILRLPSHAARLFVAGLLLVSASSHLFNGYQLFASVLNYQLVPTALAIPTAMLLPYAQLTLGVALFFVPSCRRAALALSLLLFSLFLLAQFSAYHRDLDISCGCFGTSGSRIGWQSLSIAAAGLVFTALALIGSRTAGGSK
jgi:hypothetical protein